MKATITVVNPPDNDIYNLVFDGQKNMDKSKVLDLSLKLCLAKKREKKLVTANAFLQSQLLVAKQVIGQVPQAIGKAYQIGHLQGLSENTIESFILGRQVGRIEGVIVGYKKGVADALATDEKRGLVVSLKVIEYFNTGNMNRPQSERATKVGFASRAGAYTPQNGAVRDPRASDQVSDAK